MSVAANAEALTEEVREPVLREGAVLFGVGGADRFEGAARGPHPAEIVRGARAVAAFGIPLVEQAADWDERASPPSATPPRRPAWGSLG